MREYQPIKQASSLVKYLLDLASWKLSYLPFWESAASWVEGFFLKQSLPVPKSRYIALWWSNPLSSRTQVQLAFRDSGKMQVANMVLETLLYFKWNLRVAGGQCTGDENRCLRAQGRSLRGAANLPLLLICVGRRFWKNYFFKTETFCQKKTEMSWGFGFLILGSILP